MKATANMTDPICVCGVARSEHSSCGCADGFQTIEQWKAQRLAIYEQSRHEDDDYE